ncbi:hypothetical protein EC1_11570 [Faecalitalea cylindroides T2-87]|uniref:Uncharacterized protein n=1 Tax=Faecalitalea cylindroides T2-87 TaxID=717960 RepID=D4JEM9_9FIRM|nr:hypothetical protein EC1_11570 [Faecalitalea cylindroides T2-87]
MKTSLPKLGKIQDMFEEIKNKGYDAVSVFQFVKGYLARWMQWR